jgi:hypothetical protein
MGETARWHMQTIYQIHPQRVFHIDYRKRHPVCEKSEWSFFPGRRQECDRYVRWIGAQG